MLPTGAVPSETNPSESVYAKFGIALAEPYRVDGDPVSSQAESLTRSDVAETTTDYTLRTGYIKGQKVATLESVRGAALAMADDYDRDGEPDCAYAFRLFARSLEDAPSPAPPAVRHTGQ